MYIKFFYNVVQIIDRTCESVGHLSAYSHHNYIIIQGVSNMNATSFTSFFTYMLRQMVYLSGKNCLSPSNWHQA